MNKSWKMRRAKYAVRAREIESHVTFEYLEGGDHSDIYTEMSE
jgi:hypothetical protein